MVVKQEALDTFFASNPIQLGLARKLDEAFDITFAKKHGGLAFWLAEPKIHVKERFGYDKEILVIYSSYSRTDARVLTAIENISRIPDFKHRIDRVIVILIHHGDIDKTNDLIQGQADWIVVPFQANELESPNRGPLFIRSRISKCTGSVDLFGISSPIKTDKYFFGRNELVQELINRAISKQESSGLFGLRKTGKTSVLFAIQRRLADRPVLISYFDCQNPGLHAARWWQALENIAETLCHTLKNNFNLTTQVHSNYTQTNAGSNFSADIQTIISTGNIDRVILMLDEIEHITPKLSGALGAHWDKDFLPFWQAIRAAHQESKGKITFIVAGVNPESVEKTHFGNTPNPIFQLAVPHYLEPLSAQNVREMVRSIGRYAGLAFEENVYPYLANTYGGHSYLIRIACSEVWKKSNVLDPETKAIVSISKFRDSILDIQARLSQPIKDILLSLVWWYPDEYDLLRIIAGGDKKFAQEYLKDNLHHVAQYIKYGILKNHEGDFAIIDLRDFLNNHGADYKKELSPFMRGDIPPELLPDVPDLVSLGELFAKRCNLEIFLRKLIIMYFGVKNNWDDKKTSDSLAKSLHMRPDRKNPHAIFIGRSPKDVVNDLYTLDLKSIITSNWDMFSSLFDGNKSRFEMNMDSINQARRVEAHTKPISTSEMEDFNNSYGWLFKRINKVPNLSI